MTIRLTLVYCKIFLGVFYTMLLDTIVWEKTAKCARNGNISHVIFILYSLNNKLLFQTV